MEGRKGERRNGERRNGGRVVWDEGRRIQKVIMQDYAMEEGKKAGLHYKDIEDRTEEWAEEGIRRKERRLTE